MEASVYNLEGKEVSKITLPKEFEEPFRIDLVRRAILSEQSATKQPQGHSVTAGLNTTAVYVGAYGVYRTGRHMGIAIRPRQKLAGGAMGDVRRIPSATKGRRAHPHKIEKVLREEINEKEYRKAIASAIGGTASEKELKQRLQEIKANVPIVVEDSIEKISKTKELIKILKNLGLDKVIEDAKEKVRKKTGHARYAVRRHYKKNLLIVVGNPSQLENSSRNIAGVDVCKVNDLRVGLLAPGAMPRVVVWTASAISKLSNAINSIKPV